MGSLFTQVEPLQDDAYCQENASLEAAARTIMSVEYHIETEELDEWYQNAADALNDDTLIMLLNHERFFSSILSRRPDLR